MKIMPVFPSFQTISWDRISRAVDFYVENGFRYIEVPWIVEDRYVKATYPKDCPEEHAFQTKLGTIIGSAEQSFIALASNGTIEKEGKVLVAVTPCFRDYQPDDRYHQPYFMKVELFSSYKHLTAADLMCYAGKFFAKEGAIIEKRQTETGLDWDIDGLEIGSYGTRRFGDLVWSYGTGLAEPRFSQALRQQGSLRWSEPFKSLDTQIEDVSDKDE